MLSSKAKGETPLSAGENKCVFFWLHYRSKAWERRHRTTRIDIVLLDACANGMTEAWHLARIQDRTIACATAKVAVQ